MYWKPYVSAAERQRKAFRHMEKLRKKGLLIQPVTIEGRTIARSFWGKGWCRHLESFSDYENRLPRGRTYVRNGSVCHLDITPGSIEAMVCGSDMYRISIGIRKLKEPRWKAIQKKCTGQIGSMVELLQGTLSSQVMAIVTDQKNGLFPLPGEITMNCSCPDWAVMCKHVAAVLYGVGSRLDTRPDLLFVLRDVDPEALIGADIRIPEMEGVEKEDVLGEAELSGIFGIDLDMEERLSPSVKAEKARTRPRVAPTPQKRKTGRKAPKKTRHSAAPPPFRATGRFISRMRRTLNLSVADFAALVGVTPLTVRRWEGETARLVLRSRTLTALTELHEKMST